MHESCASAVRLERNLTNIDCMCLWLIVAVSTNMDDDQFGRGEFVFRRAPLSMCKLGHAVASEWTALFVCAGKKLYLQGETPGYANLLKPP